MRAVVVAALAALLIASDGHATTSDASQEGSLLARVATVPPSGTGLAITARGVQRGPSFSLDLYARRLDARGTPTGGEALVGADSTPHLAYGDAEQIGIADDPRRDRFLVAWSGHEDGMARQACDNPPGPGGLPPAPCERRDQEIFVRVVGGDGVPAGPARRVSATGPPDRTEFAGVTPAVAYDRRTDGYLLVYAATTRGEAFRGELFAQRLTSEGEPAGEARRLDLRPGADSAAPLIRLAPDPAGGFLLAFTWGPELNRGELFTAKLDATGDPGRVRAISRPGGPGAGGLALAPDREDRRALVLWSDARAGARTGFHARLLRAGGRPAERAVRLPFEQGFGRVAVSADTDGDGWRYAFVEEDRSACSICRRVSVRRARRDGRPSGRKRRATPSGVIVDPVLAPLERGAQLLGWTEAPQGPGQTGRSLLRRLR